MFLWEQEGYVRSGADLSGFSPVAGRQVPSWVDGLAGCVPSAAGHSPGVKLGELL